MVYLIWTALNILMYPAFWRHFAKMSQEIERDEDAA